MRLSLLCVVLISATAQASPQLPCEPALAADQKILNRLVVSAEAEQFRVMGQWSAAKEQLQTAERKRDQLKRDMQRSSTLLESRTTSVTKHAIAAHAYRMGEVRASQLQSDLERLKVECEIAKRNVISEGNPNLDLSADYVALRIEALKAEQTGLQAALSGAEVSVAFYEGGLNNGKKLFANNSISESELEVRQMRYDDAVAQVSTVKTQLETVQASLAGLELSRKKLLSLKK